MKNKLILGLIAIGAILGLLRYQGNSQSTSRKVTPEKSITTEKEIVVIQTLHKESPDEVTVNQGETALDLLQQTADITLKGEGENAFVTSINGIVADDTKKEFWAFYVNSEQAEVGAGSYLLQSGDKIAWKLETY